MVPRDEVDAFFERVPEHVLTVLDEAYFEYVDEPDYPDGIEEYLKAGRNVLVLRTFSKIYGLAGLRVGYGVGPREVVDAVRKVRNAFDVTQPAQDAALASLGDARRARAAGGPQRRGARRSSSSSAPGSTCARAAARRRTSSTSRWADDARRSSRRCCARA